MRNDNQRRMTTLTAYIKLENIYKGVEATKYKYYTTTVYAWLETHSLIEIPFPCFPSKDKPDPYRNTENVIKADLCAVSLVEFIKSHETLIAGLPASVCIIQ